MSAFHATSSLSIVDVRVVQGYTTMGLGFPHCIHTGKKTSSFTDTQFKLDLALLFFLSVNAWHT